MNNQEAFKLKLFKDYMLDFLDPEMIKKFDDANSNAVFDWAQEFLKLPMKYSEYKKLFCDQQEKEKFKSLCGRYLQEDPNHIAQWSFF